jgi:tRNA-splicing ligase RtcB
MAAGANFAWSNRQLITWEVRNAWRDVLGSAGGELKLVYDVSHNIAKIEEYDGREMVVHRKGATRAFPGQVVLIPGSMGTRSYVLVGEEQSLKETFGSSCHGAGRRMSRTKAKHALSGAQLKKALEQEGIVVSEGSLSGLAEEAPQAYKDVDQVVDVVHRAGIATRIARLKPLAVIKG